VYHEFEVPEPGELRVSTPILTDVLQPSAGGEAAPPRPVPLARDTFAPGRTVYYAFQIHGAQAGPGQAPRVLTGYRIETIDGTVVATRPPTALSPGTNGELSQMFALDLTRVAPGDYVFVLNVRDYVAGKRLELYDPFRVAGVPGSRY
jgi:hypothetical protein